MVRRLPKLMLVRKPEQMQSTETLQTQMRLHLECVEET